MFKRQTLIVTPAIVVVFLGVTAFGQIDRPMIPPERDLGDLFRRASASRTVVVGTVIKSEGVSKRLSPEVLEKMKTSLDEAFAGSLYTVQVKETICAAKDFQPDSTARAPEKENLYFLFVPGNEPLWKDGFQKESLLEGRKYLLFLELPDRVVQLNWTNSFQLDPKRRYYRGTQRSRGVVPLTNASTQRSSPKQQPVLEKLIQLCQAVRPPKVPDKLANLKRLADSDDPVLQKEANLAIEALKSRVKPHT